MSESTRSQTHRRHDPSLGRTHRRSSDGALPWLFLTLLCLCCAGLMSLQPGHAAEKLVHFDSPDQEALYQRLLEEYRCLKCQNQNLAGSNADLAADLKREIHQQVLAGKNKADIDDYLVARYGEFVLYRPRFNAVTALLWIGPFVMLAGGIAGIVVMARKNVRERQRNPDQENSAAGGSNDPSLRQTDLDKARRLLDS